MTTIKAAPETSRTMTYRFPNRESCAGERARRSSARLRIELWAKGSADNLSEGMADVQAKVKGASTAPLQSGNDMADTTAEDDGGRRGYQDERGA
ncbi:hypothetical protein [Aminobacter sp. BE322]|uniref:hypothetical protein n=1 Tax=unclassified Aminobacter TaxID=2644704 RepID=UPI003D248904